MTDVNIGEELSNLINRFKEYSRHEKVDRDAWERYLDENPVGADFELHEYVCPAGPRSVPWTWRWEQGNLSINFDTTMTIQALPTHVTSPKLRGNFWSQIQDLQLTTDYDKMTVTGHCEHIPVLIRGGDDIDPHSMFFLGLLAFNLKSMDFFVQWLAEAASEGEANAEQMLGRYLMTNGNQEEALYWLARSVLEHDDDMSVVGLCSMLWNGSKSILNPKLAEALLLEKVKQGRADAMMELGCLYLKGCEPIAQDVQKGIRLLKESARRGDKEAQRILDELNLPEEPTSIVDAVLAFGVTVAVLGSAFLVRRIFRRK